MSYGELNERANRVAHYLRKEGVGVEDVVGISMERSAEMVVGLLGILKAGAAYLPLDPEYPEERLAYMISNAKPVRVISRRKESGGLRGQKGLILLDDAEVDQALSLLPASNPDHEGRGAAQGLQHPAYVIYTSGSTGRPKGVVVAHQGVAQLVLWMVAALGRDRLSQVCATTSLNFDVSVAEIFPPLSCAGCLWILAKVTDLAEAKPKQAAGCLSTVPSAAEMLLQQSGIPKWASMIVLAGEVLWIDLVTRIQDELPSVPVINAYGPTESTVYATSWFAGAQLPDSLSAPIGRPIWNTQMYVLDGGLKPVPLGVAGEIYIGGTGLARGYVGRPGQTGERFVANPYGGEGERMYRTGDVGRWGKDGNLEFLGRVDEQVKIRGYRVEPGELEAVLRSHGGVRQAAVVVREDGRGGKQLVGYVVGVGSGGEKVNGRELRKYVRERLPEYMVPAAVVELESMPLTGSGKLDKRRLPAPEFRGSGERRRPRTPREEVLCGLYEEVLGVERVGIDDNFFELGGHSLLAMRLIGRIRSILGVELPVRTLFEHPTIVYLSSYLHEQLPPQASSFYVDPEMVERKG
jgi:nonribosomal peptide synthetase DhbF